MASTGSSMPDQLAHLASPQSRAIDDVFGVYAALVGVHVPAAIAALLERHARA